MTQTMNQETIMKIMDKIYSNILTGDNINKSAEKTAEEYLKNNKTVEEAAQKFINNQICICTASGAVTGLGGLATLPLSMATDLSFSSYIQMRTIIVLAYMGGWNVQDDQVKTLVYACIAGVSVDNTLKTGGIKLGNRLAVEMIKKIPGESIKNINKKVGIRLLSRFGNKGIIRIANFLPIVGSVVSGGFNLVESKNISDRAYRMFILNN